MNATREGPAPYRVAYSERVLSAFKALVERAAARGLEGLFLEAAKEIDVRLHIYPQFGQPLRDLATPGETLWIATVKPMVVRYVLDEERRLVFVVSPFGVLSGFDVQDRGN